MNYYEITFITKKGGEKHWIIHIEAGQTAAAKIKMESMWRSDSRFSDMHQFGIKVRRLRDTEEFKYHYFALNGE